MGNEFFPDCLDRSNALNFPGATRAYQGLLVKTGLNSNQAVDGDWGDQTDITTKMLQNYLGVPVTSKFDAATRAATLLSDYADDFRVCLLEVPLAEKIV
ncbi:MAG: hypothetical protein EXS52_00325 [Candidatus Staskawiczbacteria bacterium]|nr:hypothetical protein [Candidatus Staskawiczbacteria bacterium]